jgi:hypothetical protein
VNGDNSAREWSSVPGVEWELLATVAKSLARWKPDGIQGSEDCKDLFEIGYNRLAAAGHESRFIASDA